MKAEIALILIFCRLIRIQSRYSHNFGYPEDLYATGLYSTPAPHMFTICASVEYSL